MTLAFPECVEPMAATLTQERFTGPEWIFERKLDGIRLLAFKDGPSCGGPLRIIAFLAPPEPVHAILDHLGLPSRPPPLSPARAPPELAFDFDQRAPEFSHEHDQTPALDAADPEPIPVFEFDQTRGT
ncbi:MAG: hypothetical protein ACREM1_04920 [Longimicrobiales bacterium]